LGRNHALHALTRGVSKALKVADLKEILKKAAVSPPPKATKADLIAKILAEPAALDAYNALHNPTEFASQQDAPSEPESVDPPKVAEVGWTVIHHPPQWQTELGF